MSNEPEKTGFLFENLVLTLSRLSIIKRIVNRLMNRKAYKSLPEVVKDDIEEIKDIAGKHPEDE